MSDMMRQDKVDYADISEQVREFCASRLYDLERSLRPLVDMSFGEVLPGHLAGYLAAIKQLGALYQATKPPVDLQKLVPMEKVAQMLAGMQERHARELAEAVAAAEQRVRDELSHGSRRSIESARSNVLAKLNDLEKRGV